MTKAFIIVAAVCVLLLVVCGVLLYLLFKSKNQTKQSNEKIVKAETKTQILKGRVLKNESFQKDNNSDTFNSSVDILHNLASRQLRE